MSLTRVDRLEARLAPFDWSWADANREAIAAHWEARSVERPALFNGRVLMVREAVVREGVCRAELFATDYANLIAWIDGGQPDGTVANGFAMGALQAADGAFLLGRMAAHTANAGRLYFPCGTPDLSDVAPSGAVDLAGSLVREIGEETGFAAAELAIEDGWTVVRDGGLLAFMRRVRLRLDGETARRRILSHLAREARPELSDVRLVREFADIASETRMPGVVPLYLKDVFTAASVSVAQG